MTREHSFSAGRGVLNYLHASAYVPTPGQGLQTSSRTVAAKALTVAISREAGIDAGAYARAIGERLDWPVWDHELLELVSRHLKSRVSELEALDERHIGVIQESMEAFLKLHAVNQHIFVHHLREVMEELAARGNCIIVGRGSPHILPRDTTLKVRLVAPREQRIATLQQQMGIADAGSAARELDKIDRERVRFVAEHFHRDAKDPAAYDIVLNSSRFSPSECARLLAECFQEIVQSQ